MKNNSPARQTQHLRRRLPPTLQAHERSPRRPLIKLCTTHVTRASSAPLTRVLSGLEGALGSTPGNGGGGVDNSDDVHVRELNLFGRLVKIVPEGPHRRSVVLPVCVRDHRRLLELVVVNQHAVNERHVVRLELELALLFILVLEADEACVGKADENLGRGILAEGDVEALRHAVHHGVDLVRIADVELSEELARFGLVLVLHGHALEMALERQHGVRQACAPAPRRHHVGTLAEIEAAMRHAHLLEDLAPLLDFGIVAEAASTRSCQRPLPQDFRHPPLLLLLHLTCGIAKAHDSDAMADHVEVLLSLDRTHAPVGHFELLTLLLAVLILVAGLAAGGEGTRTDHAASGAGDRLDALATVERTIADRLNFCSRFVHLCHLLQHCCHYLLHHCCHLLYPSLLRCFSSSCCRRFRCRRRLFSFRCLGFLLCIRLLLCRPGCVD
mmetsp:Transcript_70933/g.117861  ORF Transcript_70933/g.117861 Transcript_70933/m.117861 type:complete len:442 (-) Transcript_70933:434-1759(-)